MVENIVEEMIAKGIRIGYMRDSKMIDSEIIARAEARLLEGRLLEGKPIVKLYHLSTKSGRWSEGDYDTSDCNDNI